MKRLLTYCLLLVAGGQLVSCWAPRCPMKSCHVKMEHRHEGMVYRGRSVFASRVHGFGFAAKNRSGDADEQSAFRKNKDPKTKKKFRKLLPWEKTS